MKQRDLDFKRQEIMVASKATTEQLVSDAEVVFKKVVISCKVDGEDPPEEVSGGEPSIGVAGLTWFPKIKT